MINYLLLISVYLTGCTAFAQVYNSSVAAATAGSGRAAIEPGDALFLNPATLVHLREKKFFSSFAKSEMAFSLSDNSEDAAIPGGLGFLQTKSEAGGITIRNQDLHLSVAEVFLPKFSFGITAHYFKSDVNEARFSQTNADGGFLFTPNEHSGIAVVGYNFFGQRTDVPEAVRLKPSLAFAYHYIYKSFIRLRADLISAPDYNFGQSTLALGYETFFSQWLIWRLGYQYNKLLDRNMATTGLGFDGPRFKINYAYQLNTKDSGDYRHSIDLVIPF